MPDQHSPVRHESKAKDEEKEPEVGTPDYPFPAPPMGHPAALPPKTEGAPKDSPKA